MKRINPNECPYCHPDLDGYVKPMERKGRIFIYPTFGSYKLIARWANNREECVINFCPLCGRNLKGLRYKVGETK